MNVVLHSHTGSFSRGLEKRAHVDVETAVGITGGYDLGAAVVTVLTHLCNHDTGLTALSFGEGFAHLLCFDEVGVLMSFVCVHA